MVLQIESTPRDLFAYNGKVTSYEWRSPDRGLTFIFFVFQINILNPSYNKVKVAYFS